MNKSNLAVKDEELTNNIELAVASNEMVKTDVGGRVIEIEKPQTAKKEKNTKIGILYFICKKTIDIFSGLLGTLLLIPVTIIVYLMRIIKHENDGPIFYTQLRIGKNGKQFKLYKFRTMVMNADEKLEEYLKENKELAKEYKKYKKLKHDPRITKIGDFLRKTSLDEFPQFINVLKGEMSLVGPRPYLNREKEDIPEEYYGKIIKVKPGITGYWQVNGRSDVDFEERTYMDTYYIEHRSFIMDIKIIIKTALKMFKREGAI